MGHCKALNACWCHHCNCNYCTRPQVLLKGNVEEIEMLKKWVGQFVVNLTQSNALPPLKTTLNSAQSPRNNMISTDSNGFRLLWQAVAVAGGQAQSTNGYKWPNQDKSTAIRASLHQWADLCQTFLYFQELPAPYCNRMCPHPFSREPFYQELKCKKA